MNSEQEMTYIYEETEDAGEDSENDFFEHTLVDSEEEDEIDGEDIELAISLERELAIEIIEPESSINVNPSQVATPIRRGRGRPPKPKNNTIVTQPCLTTSSSMKFIH